ncbi:MYG1 protein [Glossina fuscipes fuscipes]
MSLSSKITSTCRKLFVSRFTNSFISIAPKNMGSKAENQSGAGCGSNSTSTIGTHSGTFHCDEVLACFMLKQLAEYENAEILRSRNDEELQKKCSIIVDVGNVFNHERKLYDHHQASFQETLSSLRPELGDKYKIRLSSAGLIYNYYGERVIDSILKKHGIDLSDENLRLAYIQVYQNFINEIDAIDNGVPLCPDGQEPLYLIGTHISARVGKLNLSWDDEMGDCQDDRFRQAMCVVGNEFVEKILYIGRSWIRAREYVRNALENATKVYESGEILLLERTCPWKQHLFDLEQECDIEGRSKLVIFEDPLDKSWRVAGVPVTPQSFLGRQFLPKEWCGLRNDDLFQAAGVKDLLFVHSTGFIGGAKNKEAALAMAIKSLQWPRNNETKEKKC